MATTMTADQLAQAKAQIAQTKVVAIQAVFADLTNGTATVATLIADVATALGEVDTTDAAYQDVKALSNLLTLSPANLTNKLAPLQAIAASAPASGS